jgi:3'-5' exoribonuclease
MGVKDWGRKGRIWGELVAVRDVQLQPRGPKGPQLTAVVFDTTGARTAKSWDLPASQVKLIITTAAQVPPVLRVSGTIEASGMYAGELTLCDVTPADPGEYDEANFLEALPDDHPVLVERLDQLIAQVRDPYLSALLAKTIGLAGSLRAAYLTGTAAKKNHHTYRGGLLQHSLEVAELALHTAYRFPKLRRDLILTAALLHDVGKLWEMDHDWQRGNYTDAGTMLGHIFLGAERIGALSRGLRFPEDLRLALMHTMLAHHDELTFGSPVCPMLPEAITLAKCDQISAELAAFFQSQNDATPAQRAVWKGDRPFFIGALDLGAALAPSDPLPDDPEERLMHRLSAAEDLIPMFGTTRLPILGIVAAGDGIRSSEEQPDPEEREVLLPPGGASFLLRVTGDSMIGAGIVEGDLLLVRRQETARVGQIVVAYVPGSGPVVKRLTETEEGRFLTSENTAYEPIAVDEGVQLQGVVVRLEREM